MAEQFTNTFQNGMNSDYNVVLQPNGTYRFAANCSLVSQDGNNYVIKDCLGNVRTFNINIRYAADSTHFDTPPMPIGFISFPDKLIVFSTNNESVDGGYGEIGMIKYLPYGEGVMPLSVAGEMNAGYVPLYHHDDLKFSKLYRIEGFGLKETDNIERCYWTDNFNEPRVFNISDPIFTDYIPSGYSFGDAEYMVVEGVVEFPIGSGDFYGPTTGSGSIIGNIMPQVVSVGYTATTGTSPTPKVIRYLPPTLLSWTPDRLLGNIQFQSFSAGNVFCGNKIYFYRLGLNSGYISPWSYPSAPTHVGIESIYSTSYNYTNQVGGGTSTQAIRSNKSLNILISNVDPDFDYIEMACAEFDNLSDVPRQISIVARASITSGSALLNHNGNNNYGELTLSDITLFPVTILQCKTIATDKNYMLVGNIKEKEELDIDLTGVTISSFNYPMPMVFDVASCSNQVVYQPEVPPVTGNPGAGDVVPNSRWYVERGEASVNTVSYNGNLYLTGSVITGVASGGGFNAQNTITTAGLGQVRPCVTKNRYTPFGTSDRRENAITLSGDFLFWDYKSAAVHQHAQGYWSNEKYRFGILFYDKKGNPMYVRWIGDYTMPDVASKGGLLVRNNYGGLTNGHYSLNPSGVKFSNILIPADIIDEISGFSIVRAHRDARIITQGLVSQTYYDAGAGPGTAYPVGFLSNTTVTDFAYSLLYQFISPDLLVDAPLKGSVGVKGDTVESIQWVSPVTNTGNVATGYGGTEQIVTKLINDPNAPTPVDAAQRTGTITYFVGTNERDSIVNFNGTGKNIYNVTQITAGTGNVISGTCLGTGSYGLDTWAGIGGKKSFFMLGADFYSFNPPAAIATYLYTNTLGSRTSNKVLMNYCKANVNQYGGIGANALAATTYMSTGHFQPINSVVKSETDNGAGYYVFNNVEVFGGDCFVNYIDYGYSLWTNDAAVITGSYSYVFAFPCECNANYGLRNGRKTSNVEMYHTDSGSGPATAESIIYTGPMGEVRLEGFEYNKGYSAEGQIFLYPALPENFLSSSRFQSRIRYAGQKFLGETIDSFRRFLINDYKDLDTVGGEINNIKVKDARVVVWQNKLTSTVPILERLLLSGLDGAATTLGTGGVVTRYDPITSYFGNQHQWSVIETEYGFAWFDMRRKAFMLLAFDGTGLIEESQVGGLNAFFNEVFFEVTNSDAVVTNLLNDPNFAASSDRPLMGVGITGVFDPKFKMTYMTFKFSERAEFAYFRKDFTIGYLHTPQTKCFVSFYDFLPSISHNHNQFVISVNDPKNITQYLFYSGVLTGFVFVPGETLPLLGVEYVCILTVTIGAASTLPGYVGSIYWVAVNAQNQLWVHNQPTDFDLNPANVYAYNTFFGKAVSNKLHIIINPQVENDFEVTNIEQCGSSVNYTDVETETDTQSASDLAITSTNRNYRTTFSKITSNLPLSSSGRIVNDYLKIKFTKKNWTTNPRVVVLATKILQSINSLFTQKR